MFNLPENFWIGIFGSFIFGVVGIFLLVGGFKLFDLILPRVDFQKEMAGNPLATSIVIGSFFLALAHIIASCLH